MKSHTNTRVSISCSSGDSFLLVRHHDVDGTSKIVKRIPVNSNFGEYDFSAFEGKNEVPKYVGCKFHAVGNRLIGFIRHIFRHSIP